ncbi:MAG: folylpolyglutamate synthase/dihydrofolate synthase family protein [Verrucomicrobiae bacterium]
MTPDESLAWLDGAQHFGVKLGLDNTRRLLDAAGCPEARLKIFHVAGTNGKGSVCAMLDSALRAAGLRTGLYTSPHLTDFRERIRVNGERIPPSALGEILTRIRQDSGGWEHSPTFFEIATVLAIDHFARQNCEAVVLETGLGGRLDATNAAVPMVAALTPIALDHAQWLGGTLEEIAGEKAGIIKPGIPVVSAPQAPEVRRVIEARARACGSPISFVSSPYPGPVGLCGEHQKWNAAVALAALEASSLPACGEAAARGLREVSWPARFQRIGGRTVVDGAHNPHAAKCLVETWKQTFGSARATVVFGALNDKDYAEMIALLSEVADAFFFVPVASPRSADVRKFPALTGLQARTFPSLQRALEAAGEQPVLITGSLFLCGEALSLLLPDSFPSRDGATENLQ